MGRRIFIGDIQGCRVELERLLEKLNFDPAADELHPVGDLVNRGPDSLGSLRLLRSLDAGGVLGNHDLHLLAVAAGTRTPGGRDTLDEVLAAEDRGELLAWLADRPFLRVFDDVLLVHAGLHPRWDSVETILAELDPGDPAVSNAPMEPGAAARFAVNIRLCDEHGEHSRAGHTVPHAQLRPWHEYLAPNAFGGRTVVFGHWAAQGLLLRPGLVGLDSGCVWGGKLSAWIAEEDRIVQVPAERAYAEFS